ncbi:MAG TPA: hypothetical protein V6C97_01715 [Oculatellaceae cyanobacterium]
MPKNEIPLSMPVGEVQLRMPVASFPAASFPLSTSISDVRAAAVVSDRVPAAFGPAPTIEVPSQVVAERPALAIDAAPSVESPRIAAPENPLSTPTGWEKSLASVDLENRSRLEGDDKVTIDIAQLKAGENPDILIKADGKIVTAPNLSSDLANLTIRYEDGASAMTVQNALKELKDSAFADRQISITTSDEAKKLVPDTFENDLNRAGKPGDLDDAPQKRGEETCGGTKGNNVPDRPPNHMPEETNTTPEDKTGALRKEQMEKAAAVQEKWDAVDTNLKNLGGFQPENYGSFFYGMFPSGFWDELAKAMNPPPGDPAKIKTLMDKYEVSKKLSEASNGLDESSQKALTAFGDRLKSLGSPEGLQSASGQELARNLQGFGEAARNHSLTGSTVDKLFDPSMKKAFDHAIVANAFNGDSISQNKYKGDISNLSQSDVQTVLSKLIKKSDKNSDLTFIPSAF